MKKTIPEKGKKKASRSASISADRIESSLLDDLYNQKLRYERYFLKEEQKKNDSKPDHQAATAYAALIKTTAELARKIKEEKKKSKLSEEKIRELALEIFRNDYGVAVDRS
jgi:hypothetical protein